MVRLVHARVCVLETRSPVCVLNCMRSLDARGNRSLCIVPSSSLANPFLLPSSPFSFPHGWIVPLLLALSSPIFSLRPVAPLLSPFLSRYLCLRCPRELVLGHSKRLSRARNNATHREKKRGGRETVRPRKPIKRAISRGGKMVKFFWKFVRWISFPSRYGEG